MYTIYSVRYGLKLYSDLKRLKTCGFNISHVIYIADRCLDGYTGNWCEKTCTYPYYGQACQKQCLCSKERCHFVTGCNDTKGNSGYITNTLFWIM